MSIQVERIKSLNDLRATKGHYVLYWMQASARSQCNHALEYAISQANDLNLPLLVFFGLTDSFPEANVRHYAFMLEGLQDTQSALRERGVQMVVWHCPPPEGVLQLAGDAALVVTDRGYMRLQRTWRQQVAERLDRLFIQVESDVIVPVEVASSKEQWAAATLRPRIHRAWGRYLVPLEEREPRRPSIGMDLADHGMDLTNIGGLLANLAIDHSVSPVSEFVGGTGEACRRLDDFIQHKLAHFAEWRNDPGLDGLSHMSPFLHFGQISPLYIALRIQAVGGPGAEAYLEELVVRRELAINYVFYSPRYDVYAGLPDWTRKTLHEHRQDCRQPLYSADELERAETHDPYWNAAQKEMVSRGKMHGYMRMYWGKKILEWSRTPEEAFATALALNNKYELDGRDPNGYTGVAWCFGKHDRPWKERPIFGKIRYMSAAGLKRKFDMEAYLQRVARHRLWEAK